MMIRALKILSPFFLVFATLAPALEVAQIPGAGQAPKESPDFPKYLEINLTQQRARLIENKKVIWESVASTGREEKRTQTGIFKITDKKEKWTSTIYHVPMPYFQRFSHSPVGIHAGPLPGFPGSAGCIRLPEPAARELFQKTEIGLPVVIVGETPPFEYFKQVAQEVRSQKHSPTFAASAPAASKPTPTSPPNKIKPSPPA
ncbi:MAG: L,D-transpeptidase [Blastochloris sp.]|nr:L,D-transpeptidase [Blastochloris sp.]